MRISHMPVHIYIVTEVVDVPSPEEISMAITVAAISISRKIRSEDCALLGAAFTQLGDTLATISVVKEREEAAQEKAGSTQTG